MKEKTHNYSKGFGIIEVLVSAMILIIVVGAVVGLSRTMVRKNVETGEKVQAYNLVREGLEIGRAYRDTIWIDEVSNNFDDKFPVAGEEFVFVSDNTENTGEGDSFEIEVTNEGEKITKDNIEYTRVYEISSLSDATISDLDDIVNVDEGDDYDLADEIMTLNVKVSWNDNENNVEAATILSDWKPQI